MTTAPNDLPEDDDTYEPQPAEILDGAALLADPYEFFEMTKAHAAIVRDGALYVLLRDTMKWVNVESISKPVKDGVRLSSVKSAK